MFISSRTLPILVYEPCFYVLDGWYKATEIQDPPDDLIPQSDIRFHIPGFSAGVLHTSHSSGSNFVVYESADRRRRSHKVVLRLDPVAHGVLDPVVPAPRGIA